MSIQSAKRKMSLEERTTALKAKNASRKLPAKLATPEIRRKRLIAIQKRMNMTHPDFREMLGMTEQHWRSVREGLKPVVVGIVKLAEIELTRFLANEYRNNRQVVPDIPAEYETNTALMGQVITAHIIGKSNDEIAAEFGIRPDIVTYYISRLS